MPRKILIGMILFLLLFCSHIPTGATFRQTDLPSTPQVVFLYPEGLQNGSSFSPATTHFYYTLTGNLSLIKQSEGISDYYFIRFKRNKEAEWITGSIDDSIGSIDLRIPNSSYLDVWHNITIETYTKGTSTLINNQSFQFFANSSLVDEPLDITLINYSNNSLIPYTDYKSTFHLYFNVSGYTIEEGIFNSTTYCPLKFKEVKATYKWNDNSWRQAQKPYDSMTFNIFFLDIQDIDGFNIGTDSNATLFIKLENNTHTQIFKYIFYFYASEYTEYYHYVWYGEHDKFYWRAGEQKTISVKNLSTTVIYNWHDDSGNHTILPTDWSGEYQSYIGHLNITIPNFSLNNVGYRYLSLWVNDNPEIRYTYGFEAINPQINIFYPNDDIPKSGIVPVVWSLRTLLYSDFDFRDFEFNLSYQLEGQLRILLVSDKGWLDSPDPRSNFDWFNSKNILIIGFDFYPNVVFQEIPETTVQVRFIINELTTNTVFNQTVDIQTKVAGLSSEPIKSATSEWITIKSSYIAPSPNDPTETDDQTSSDTHEGAPTPFSMIGVLIAIVSILFIKKKSKQ
ncbi:MAG: hypothetical protein ACFE9L_00745 [Candidatus Hodarchaeota archaeon]